MIKLSLHIRTPNQATIGLKERLLHRQKLDGRGIQAPPLKQSTGLPRFARNDWL